MPPRPSPEVAVVAILHRRGVYDVERDAANALQYVTKRVECRLNYERPLEVGDRIEIGGRQGIVSTIESVLRERELPLVVQLSRDRR